jgi:hypothetical protein
LITDEQLLKQIEKDAKKTVVRSFEYDDILDGVARGAVHAKIGQLKAIEILHNRSAQVLNQVFSDNNSSATNNSPINLVFKQKDDTVTISTDAGTDNKNLSS